MLVNRSIGVRARTALSLVGRLGLSVRDGGDQLLNDLAAGFVAQILNLFDLVVGVLLCVIFSLLVTGAVLLYC